MHLQRFTCVEAPRRTSACAASSLKTISDAGPHPQVRVCAFKGVSSPPPHDSTVSRMVTPAPDSQPRLDNET